MQQHQSLWCGHWPPFARSHLAIFLGIRIIYLISNAIMTIANIRQCIWLLIEVTCWLELVVLHTHYTLTIWDIAEILWQILLTCVGAGMELAKGLTLTVRESQVVIWCRTLSCRIMAANIWHVRLSASCWTWSNTLGGTWPEWEGYLQNVFVQAQSTMSNLHLRKTLHNFHVLWTTSIRS